MRITLTILLSIGLFNIVFPCGNEYGYNLDGTRLFTRYFYLSDHMRHFDRNKIDLRLTELDMELESDNTNFKTWSDISVNLLKIGQVDSALNILQSLAINHPKEYNVLANLGTAYELNGDLDSALTFISKGFQLNPNSHHGSEWIHVKILEAKIKEKRNPGWIRKNEVVALSDLLAKHNGNKNNYGGRQINNNMFYQIRTRVKFTPAPNKILTNLLITMGDFNAKVGTYENALLAYTYAMEFQSSIGILRDIKKKIKALNTRRDEQEEIKELPEAFMSMMKRSKIDPEILLLGLDNYAQELDSIHHAEIDNENTHKFYTQKIDSITSNATLKLLNKDEQITKADKRKMPFLLLGLILGIGLTVIIMKLRK